MNSKIYILSTVILNASLSSTAAFANSGLPLDPRSIGMGGTGVAVANSSQAHYYNPSLLVNAPADEDFNVEIDASIRYSDPDGLTKNINQFGEDKPFTNFSADLIAFFNSVETAKQNPTNLSNIEAAIRNRNNLYTSTRTLKTSIQSISDRNIFLDNNLGLFISRPKEDYGWTLYFNAFSPISIKGILAPNDTKLMTDIENLLAPNPGNISLTDLESMSDTLNTTNPLASLDSVILLYGADVREIGFSIAKKATMNTYNFDMGITPKLVLVNALDVTYGLKKVEEDKVKKIDDIKEEYRNFNVDLGISKTINENWRSGLAIKNLLSQSYKTPNGHEITIEPAARIGISYTSSKFNFAADFDLTENNASVGNSSTQYLSLGAEVDVWLLQLRAGYRNDFVNNFAFPSLGVGLYLFGLNVDIAAAGTLPDEIRIDTPSDIVDTLSGVEDFTLAARLGIKW